MYPLCCSYVGVTIGPAYKHSSGQYDVSKDMRKVSVLIHNHLVCCFSFTTIVSVCYINPFVFSYVNELEIR